MVDAGWPGLASDSTNTVFTPWRRWLPSGSRRPNGIVEDENTLLRVITMSAPDPAYGRTK
ncbi:Uncharacterised protein [Mycobacteroides abscessus subsp. massiliense]|nr:Uncharacterised protein [Mycobacteroides abscessus subsp. massiliense]